MSTRVGPKDYSTRPSVRDMLMAPGLTIDQAQQLYDTALKALDPPPGTHSKWRKVIRARFGLVIPSPA